jgi:hypothetical protein
MSEGVTAILNEMRDLGERDRVSVGDLLETFGSRGYGAALLVPALIEVSPVGGIPGVPTALALILASFAVQIAMERDHLTLPGFVERRSVKGGKLQKMADKLKGLGERLDRWFHGRLRRLTDGWWARVAAFCVIGLTLMVPPLEFVPFASTAPMIAIAAFGLAMLVHDGALMLAAFVLSGAAVVAAGWMAMAALG